MRTGVSARVGAAAVLAATALIAGAAAAAAAFGADLRLAPNVTRAESYTAPKKTAYVTSIPGLIYQTPSFMGRPTGLALALGERVQGIAETDEGRWVLVGRNNVGVGYVARSTLCPTDVCGPNSGTASPPR